MAKPRPATSEEVEFVRKYIENAGIKIDNCEIRVSAAGNIVCKNRATQQDILVIEILFFCKKNVFFCKNPAYYI